MNLRQCLDNLSIRADWVGIREISEKISNRSARNGRIDRNSASLDHGFMVEVLVDGQFAYACTSTHTEEAIHEAAVRASKLACKAKAYQLHSFKQSVRPKAEGHFSSSPRNKTTDLSLKDLTDVLLKNSEVLKASDKIVNTVASGMIIERSSRMVSSNGSDSCQDITSIQVMLSATAQDGAETQTRSNGSPYRQLGMEVFNAHALEEISRHVGREALELLSAEECPTGHYDVVITPDQLYLQVHESIGHPLELDRILGDERNYAGWSFVKPSDFGTLRYGSKLLNVTFDPCVQTEAASYNFDDVGNKATREYLIKDGVLLRGLGSLESQERLGIPGVANSRVSSWNRPPIDRMANINIEPGDTSFDQMIGQIENGILMKTNRSWSIDDYRNKFQFGCEYARRIQNGQLTTVLKNPNYRGISVPFWTNLKAVGDQSTFEITGSPYCGKGEPNQIIRVGHAVPTCWFGDVEVFGGGA